MPTNSLYTATHVIHQVTKESDSVTNSPSLHVDKDHDDIGTSFYQVCSKMHPIFVHVFFQVSNH